MTATTPPPLAADLTDGMRRCSPSSAQLARSGHACTRRPNPGVLREVLLARIGGDVAGALSLPVLRRKVILTPVIRLLARLYPEQFRITRTGRETRHTQRSSLGLRHSTTLCP